MSSLVFSFHDPNNIETKFLRQAFPVLKANFDHAFISVTPKTIAQNPDSLAFLQQDSFFVVNLNPDDSIVGDHVVAGYRNAVKNSSPDQVLHLCDSDRIFFALANYQEAFLNDLKTAKTPTVFIRSEKAWSTHPTNYYAAESMISTVGQILFNQNLDFAWCHLTLTAAQLGAALPNLTASDFVILAQLMMFLRGQIITKSVDWLSWEDPFIFSKDPLQYQKERETNPAELEKRMSYVLPDIQYLFEEYRKLRSIS